MEQCVDNARTEICASLPCKNRPGLACPNSALGGGSHAVRAHQSLCASIRYACDGIFTQDLVTRRRPCIRDGCHDAPHAVPRDSQEPPLRRRMAGAAVGHPGDHRRRPRRPAPAASDTRLSGIHHRPAVACSAASVHKHPLAWPAEMTATALDHEPMHQPQCLLESCRVLPEPP